MGGHGTYIFTQLDPDFFAAAAPSAGSGLRRTAPINDPEKIKDLPIWAFHGDKDSVCPVEKDQVVFNEMKRLGGNMKFTIWQGDLDLMVPFTHGQWLIKHIPNAKGMLEIGHGHISLIADKKQDIIDDLANEISSKNAFHVSKILDQSISKKR